MFSVEISAVPLTEEILVELFLLLSEFFVFHQFSYNLHQCGSLGVYPTWNLLSFLDVQISIFYHIWKVFVHYVFKYSFYFFLSFLFFLGLPKYLCWHD